MMITFFIGLAVIALTFALLVALSFGLFIYGTIQERMQNNTQTHDGNASRQQ